MTVQSQRFSVCNPTSSHSQLVKYSSSVNGLKIQTARLYPHLWCQFCMSRALWPNKLNKWHKMSGYTFKTELVRKIFHIVWVADIVYHFTYVNLPMLNKLKTNRSWFFVTTGHKPCTPEGKSSVSPIQPNTALTWRGARSDARGSETIIWGSKWQWFG